jgi:transcriptional regulator with XRE-family HTH domain
LTVHTLADRAGVAEATVFRIERGATRPRSHVVRRLSVALGVPPTEIAEFQPVAAAAALRPLAVQAIAANLSESTSGQDDAGAGAD